MDRRWVFFRSRPCRRTSSSPYSELITRNSLIMRVEFHPGGEKLHFDEEFL